ncbi:hypothetical protein EIP91_004462 [Steccherinum ochraceum]|uniref:Uncharacterized protein n=1 Tax=Steccherinum ochraceum TaxID=92696 RepID=A0A4V2MVX6_9APHY|nr:hypothetical protein EIP91_004462 [Steccherinum ochraceum]
MAPSIPVIFPAPPLSNRRTSQDRVSSSTSPSKGSSQHTLDYIGQLQERYQKLAALPLELFPSSQPGAPDLSQRAIHFRREISHALEEANYDSSDPKWAKVSRMVRMASTSRRQAAAPGIKIGQTSKMDCGDYVFKMPTTEEEWEDCTKRWAARDLTRVPVKSGEGARKGKGKERERQTTSKYWTNGTVSGRPALNRDVLAGVEGDDMQTKEDRVTSRVRSWQAEVVRAERPVPLVETPIEVGVVQAKSEKDKPKPKRQSPLEFPAFKHNGLVATAKGGQGSSKSDSARDILAQQREPPAHAPMISPERPQTPQRASPEPMQISSPSGIANVSEASFLPPSFPSHLETSTPKDDAQSKPPNDERHKPAPIYPRPFFSSSPPSPPLSTWSPFNPAHPSHTSPQPLGMSSSLPIFSPSTRLHAVAENRPLKRTRPLTPPDDDVFVTGVTKKPRTDAAAPPAQPYRSSAPLLPSSPPPVNTPPLSKSTSPLRPAPLVRAGSGLGNANGLPILETPERKDLPSLTDLLASSRQSKPRPRPPSRKVKPDAASNDSIFNQPSAAHGDNDALPALAEDEPVVPDISPAKTYFSSPASGSSQSTPPSHRHPPRSPISPLFNASHISRFSPQFTSTQHRNHITGSPPQAAKSIFKRGFGAGESQSQFSQPPGLGLARGSSGLFGMYNSQYDVEAQVGQVSDFMERDVDFDEYLRDVDEVEKEAQEAAESSQNQSQRENGEEVMA